MKSTLQYSVTMQRDTVSASYAMREKSTSHRTISGWAPLLRRLGLSAENAFELVCDRIDARFRPDRPVQIVPYRGFGTRDQGFLQARVLAYNAKAKSTSGNLWRNLANSYRRFDTDEVKGERVHATVNGCVFEQISDHEGYVQFELSGPLIENNGITQIRLSLPDRLNGVETMAELVIPPASARFGVISDIDDTIMLTGASNVLKMMRLTLLESSESRLAFPGVAEFYSALHSRCNPFFYVSSSPWNLYDFLEDFFTVKGIVPGSLQLRDFGLEETHFVAAPHFDHKYNAIERILDHYPSLPFVLIGDSGQDDAQVYHAVVERDPARIVAVYIRDVCGDVSNREVQRILADMRRSGVPALMVPDTQAAAVHAVGLGLINEAHLPAITSAVFDDTRHHAVLDNQVS